MAAAFTATDVWNKNWVYKKKIVYNEWLTKEFGYEKVNKHTAWEQLDR